MKLHEALFSYLKTYAGLTALVGTKIYPLQIPQNVNVPAVVYQLISQERMHSLGGDKGMTSPSMQLTSYATTYNTAKNVAEQVRIALQNYTGTMGSGVTIQSVLMTSEFDGYESDTLYYFVEQEFKIYYIENLT